MYLNIFPTSLVSNFHLLTFHRILRTLVFQYGTIRHEKERSLVLTWCLTAAFCARASDVCAQKTVYKKFKLIWFKMHDFSTIYMIIKTKQIFFWQSVLGTGCNGIALF